MNRGPLARLAALAAVAAVWGCGGGEEAADDATTAVTATAEIVETAPTETTATTAPPEETGTIADVELGATCTNRTAGYTVRYPEGWVANEADTVGGCRFFHPETFEVREREDVAGVAISLQLASVAYESLVDQVGRSPSERTVERDDVMLDDRRALRVESEATGEALLPEGTRVTTYYVDHGGRTVIASTVDTGELDYERNQNVLRRVVETVEVAGQA